MRIQTLCICLPVLIMFSGTVLAQTTETNGVQIHKGRSASETSSEMTSTARIDPQAYDAPTVIVRGSMVHAVPAAPGCECASPTTVVTVLNVVPRRYTRRFRGDRTWLGSFRKRHNWADWTIDQRKRAVTWQRKFEINARNGHSQSIVWR